MSYSGFSGYCHNYSGWSGYSGLFGADWADHNAPTPLSEFNNNFDKNSPEVTEDEFESALKRVEYFANEAGYSPDAIANLLELMREKLQKNGTITWGREENVILNIQGKRRIDEVEVFGVDCRQNDGKTRPVASFRQISP